jgi:predicted secreted hydrolase
MEIIWLGMSLLLATLASADDTLTAMDGVQVSRPSTHAEWLFNMGVLTGKNERGETRHLGFIVNTLIAPTPRLWGPVPIIDFDPKPVVQVMVQDLDHPQVYREQLRADSVDPESFSVSSQDLNLTRVNGRSGNLITRLDVSSSSIGIGMQIVSTKPAAYFGDQGWVVNGSLGRALYVSRTGRELDSSYRSTIRIGSETIHLKEGRIWEDHQEIGSPSPDLFLVKWNWFALQFPDHSEVLIYKLVNRATGAVYHNLQQRVRPDGSIENLPEVTMTETGHVSSRGYDLPTTWDLEIPGLARLHLEHIVQAPWYEVILGPLSDWALEGACRVQGESAWGVPVLAWSEYTNGKFIQF